MNLPFNLHLTKDDPRIPDSYGVTIFFHDGSSETLDVVNHMINSQAQAIEFSDIKGCVSVYPISSMRCFKFDERFTKLVELKLEKEREKK